MVLLNSPNTKPIRRILRKNQTDAEKKLWSKLRNKQLNGYKFFRQYNIGNYIADFYCPKLKLVLELDGGQHYNDATQQKDIQREKYMLNEGIKTLRFSNLDILKNIEGILIIIAQYFPPLSLSFFKEVVREEFAV